MIRINLLSEGRRPAVARKAKGSSPLGDQDISLWILIAGLVAGLLIAAGLHWVAASEKATVVAKLKKAQKEERRLKPILKEVNDFKKKRKRLNDQIAVIEDLTASQRGPVQVMDSVSRALPDLLWLNSMSMRGKKVSMAGRAFNTNAVASFIENLNAVPEFNEPNTKSVRRGRSGRAYEFKLDLRFRRVKPEDLLDAEEAALPEVEAATASTSESDVATPAAAGSAG